MRGNPFWCPPKLSIACTLICSRFIDKNQLICPPTCQFFHILLSEHQITLSCTFLKLKSVNNLLECMLETNHFFSPIIPLYYPFNTGTMHRHITNFSSMRFNAITKSICNKSSVRGERVSSSGQL